MLVVAEELAEFNFALWLISSFPFYTSQPLCSHGSVKIPQVFLWIGAHTFQFEDEDPRVKDFAHEMSQQLKFYKKV